MPNDYQSAFDAAFLKFLKTEEKKGRDPDITQFVANFRSQHAKALAEILVSDASKEGKRSWKVQRGFEKRNYSRWKTAFDLSELIAQVCIEMGRHCRREVASIEGSEFFYRQQAAVYLHSRSVLCFNEIQALLRSGFPDAALARWRTLHELSVVSSFIWNAGEEIALRYFKSFDVKRAKAARLYVKHEKNAGLSSFGDQELLECEAIERKILEEFGAEMRNDFGWASPFF